MSVHFEVILDNNNNNNNNKTPYIILTYLQDYEQSI